MQQNNQNDVEMGPEVTVPTKLKRMVGVKTTIPIVIGSIAQAIKRPIILPGYDWQLTHKWCAYVRGLRENSIYSTGPGPDPHWSHSMEEQDLSFMIKKVTFQIHEGFPEPLITIEKAPFEIHNAGYGEFPITITIYFKDSFERPLEYTHQLKIEPDQD